LSREWNHETHRDSSSTSHYFAYYKLTAICEGLWLKITPGLSFGWQELLVKRSGEADPSGALSVGDCVGCCGEVTPSPLGLSLADVGKRGEEAAGS